MNYSEFYKSAQETLINSLVSFWFKGRPKEQEYARWLLEKEEPLLAEPVFQSTFPWEISNENFEEHSTKLHILEKSFVNALSSEDVSEEYRFSKERHPYKHQTKSWKTMLSGQNKTIVVTSGTGSGKTECFMIPVLQDIAHRNEKDCVQAIFLYPLNALMKSQQQRMDAWCKAMPEKITYAIYNGETEKEDKGKKYTDPHYPQLVTRPQIRRNPPQILFTNPTMLNYMLVRSEDREILEKSKGKLRWILLDEAHTYTGSAAAELAMQLRRVMSAFGVTANEVNFAVTSATIGEENNPEAQQKLRDFVSKLTGKPAESIVIIGGRRVIPELNEGLANKAINKLNDKYGTKLKLADIEHLRKLINNKSALMAKDLVKTIHPSLSGDVIKSLELIDSLAEKIEALNGDGSPGALLPSRAHFFIRSIGGLYACVNSECPRHKDKRHSLGNFTTHQNIVCPACKTNMLEVAACPSCGGLILVGEMSTATGYRMKVNAVELENNPFYESDAELIDSESPDDEVEETENNREDKAYETFYYAKPENKCLRPHVIENDWVFNFENNRILGATKDSRKENCFKSLRHSENFAYLCPHCGSTLRSLNYIRASSSQMGRMLASLLLKHAEATNTEDLEVTYEGRRYITFTDNRQGAARFAMGVNQDVERSWVRGSIFHRLADLRIAERGRAKLSDEEEQWYQYFLNNPPTETDPFLFSRFNKLKLKKSEKLTVPSPQGISWDKLKDYFENNSELRKLFKHLKEARKAGSDLTLSNYLKALMLDQFGWIPKRANSLETLGLVHLSYPGLEHAKCPPFLLREGFKDDDWRSFLKICIDYLIRGGHHYMIPSEGKPFLTQSYLSRPIYPSNTNKEVGGKPVAKWPSVKRGKSKKGQKVLDVQSKMVLLLCAALGYRDPESFTEEMISNVDELLGEAWQYLKKNILDVTDKDNEGYMLDLLSNKAALKLTEKAFLCPFDNVIVDTIFGGYSPRIRGYLGEDNFERFKVKTSFDFPYFPFKTDEVDPLKLKEWMEENLKEQAKHGLVGDITEKILGSNSIFIAVEHSAQQSKDILQKYEKEFNEGHLNIMSCSTTMEMGVDIGGISAVVMNNVPPKSANYLQRAGRAGRRNETKALALTFCGPTPIGTHTWNHPEYPLTHITETPLLKLESVRLVQRHVNALLFAKFVGEEDGIKITSKVMDFFDLKDGECFYGKFLTYLDKVRDGWEKDLDADFRELVKGTGFEGIDLPGASSRTKKDIIAVNRVYGSHLGSIEKSLKMIQENAGKGLAARAIERRKENFKKTSLLTYLAENSFLPSAGIPTGLVECVLDTKDDKGKYNTYPTLHLSQAISAYSPGSKIARNEWIYQPEGIRLKTQYDQPTSRYILQRCRDCGYTVINYGDPLSDCPKCGAEHSMHGLRDISDSSESQKFTEVVEPAGFSIAWNSKPKRVMNFRGITNFVQPILIGMKPWEEKKSSAKLVIRTSEADSEILFYNKGNEHGYAFCPYCGKMAAEKDATDDKPPFTSHSHLSTGLNCPGGEGDGGSIRRHVILVGRYQTDFAEMKFYDRDNRQIKDPSTLYSLGVILSRTLTDLLGVNDGELDFGYDSQAHSIFIYDTAIGGAGYSTLLVDYLPKVLKRAYETLNGCDCDCACTKCLIDRRSQWYLNYLDRKKALDWLSLEIHSRTPPEEILKIIPIAQSVTTDFSTEIFRLLNSKEVKELVFFTNNQPELWEIENFNYSHKIKELSLTGTEVAFAVNGELDLSRCSAGGMIRALRTLIEWKFVSLEGKTPDGIQPLLTVFFSDGKSKTYFGRKLNDTIGSEWSDGEVFSFDGEFPLQFKEIEPSEMLEKLNNNDDSSVFETRLMENCQISELFNLLTKENVKNWEKIRSSLTGKDVSLLYSDRYLRTPLGVMLLTRLISAFKQEYNLNIFAISIKVTRGIPSGKKTSLPELERDFENYADRNRFLTKAIENICEVTPSIIDSGYLEHERFLSIQSKEGELCIRPDAGIAHGWELKDDDYKRAATEDFEKNWNLNPELKNKNLGRKGILYTIAYKRYS